MAKDGKNPVSILIFVCTWTWRYNSLLFVPTGWCQNPRQAAVGFEETENKEYDSKFPDNRDTNARKGEALNRSDTPPPSLCPLGIQARQYCMAYVVMSSGWNQLTFIALVAKFQTEIIRKMTIFCYEKRTVKSAALRCLPDCQCRLNSSTCMCAVSMCLVFLQHFGK